MRCTSPLALLLAAVTLSAADLPPPAPLPGPLVLAGPGPVSDDARQAFFDLAGKGKARILVIPNTEITPQPEIILKPWKDLEPETVALFTVNNRKQADDSAIVKPFADATGVWFEGGSLTKLLDTYRGSLVEKELRKLHTRGGALGGTGAGAAIFGTHTILPGEAAAKLSPGLGFLPGFLIETQPQGERFATLIATQPDHLGLGLEGSSTFVVQGRQIRVIGDGAVTLHAAAGAGKPAVASSVNAGGMLDLFQLRRTAANRAAKNSFPPAKPRDPVVAKGALVVVGGGGAGPEIWKRFLELAGGPESLIVFVPTANEDPIGFNFPEVAALQKYGAKNVHILHTRDRSRADEPKFSEPLTRANGLWFGGGRQWRFVEAYENTLTEKRFHELLARGGVIGGSSAGASIQSEYMPRGHPLGNTVMMAEGYEKGFSFLPGAAVDQHFFARKRTGDMTDLMTAYPQFLGIGIDEGTAIVVQGSTAEVIGRTKVGFYDYRNGKPSGDRDYTEVKTGGKYNLKLRNIEK